jgi:Ca2+-binding EF-hand superfamily protein
LCADFRTDAEGLEKVAKMLRLELLGEDLENEVLALRWSLPISKVRALREGFEFIDLDGSGEVERGELNRLLGLLGCQATTGLQKKALATCLDEAKKKGDLDFVGVVGVVQSYRAAVIQTIFEANTDNDCSVPAESITKVFHQAGQYVSRDQVCALLRECDIDPGTMTDLSKEMFTKIIESQNAKRSQKWQASWGFTDDEVKRVHRICIEHGLSDEDGLEIEKVCDTLEDVMFKGVAKAFRDTMMKSFMRTDRNVTGVMSFEEVLLVARHLCNRRTLEESKLAKALGLEPEAVDQLREFFDKADTDKSGSVSYKEIKLVLSELGVVKTHRQRLNMNSITQRILGHEIKEGNEDELSFAHFLQILDQLEKTF